MNECICGTSLPGTFAPVAKVTWNFSSQHEMLYQRRGETSSYLQVPVYVLELIWLFGVITRNKVLYRLRSVQYFDRLRYDTIR